MQEIQEKKEPNKGKDLNARIRIQMLIKAKNNRIL